MNSSQSITSTEITKWYGLAYTLYKHRQYSEAYPLFRALVEVAPQEVKYWKALAACLQMQKDYRNALQYYQHAQNLLVKHPDPYLYVYIADCQLALHDVTAALKTLNLAEQTAKKRKEKRVLQHVALMRSLWKKNNNSR